MYTLILNLESAQSTYESYKQEVDSDNPEPKLGNSLVQLRKLNELINEDIDSWVHAVSDFDTLMKKYMEDSQEDVYGICELLYELFTNYIPPSTYIDVSIIDNHGNLCIVIEE